MATNNVERRANVELSGSLAGTGTIAGKGTLTLSLADAARAGISLEKTPDGTSVRLSSEVGMSVLGGRDLVFSGELARMMEAKTVEGQLAMTLELSKNVDVSVSHEFKPGDDTTAVTVTLRF